ncbi:hypothetical protein [Enterococcus casseliflavus]|uniref:hypothetical protein n=1 Tax=Enterococcus casseliflavus TaxID=37734 RepID=UPI001432AF68|nr:hypothetical protein [Enterococcus casseliflavus]NKD33776.1 hypothetical protein [Enterococcus casseliflavus]
MIKIPLGKIEQCATKVGPRIKDYLKKQWEPVHVKNVLRCFVRKLEDYEIFIQDLADKEILTLVDNRDYFVAEYIILCEWIDNNGFKLSPKKGSDPKEFKYSLAKGNSAEKLYYKFLKELHHHSKLTETPFFDLKEVTTSIKNIRAELKKAKVSEDKFKEFFDRIFRNFREINVLLSKTNNYKYYSKIIRNDLVKELDIQVCPYCNSTLIISDSDFNEADFITVYDTEYNTANLDHFFPKAIFPLFALSLGNFVPSCSKCNSNFKKEKYIDLVNPRYESFDPDAGFYIKSITPSVYYDYKKSELEILFNISDCAQKKKIKHSYELFRIRDHLEHEQVKKQACEIFWKIRSTTEDAYKNYIKDYQSANGDIDEIEKEIREFLQFKVQQNKLKDIDCDYSLDGDRSHVINVEYGKLKFDIIDQYLGVGTRFLPISS